MGQKVHHARGQNQIMASIAMISEVSIRLYSLNENCTTQGETTDFVLYSLSCEATNAS